jgi:hypothetical protein
VSSSPPRAPARCQLRACPRQCPPRLPQETWCALAPSTTGPCLRFLQASYHPTSAAGGRTIVPSTTRGRQRRRPHGCPVAGTRRAPLCAGGRSSQSERGRVNLGQWHTPRAPRRRPRAARPLCHPTGTGPPWHKACWRRRADTQCVSTLRSEALPEGGVAPDRVGL